MDAECSLALALPLGVTKPLRRKRRRGHLESFDACFGSDENYDRADKALDCLSASLVENGLLFNWLAPCAKHKSEMDAHRSGTTMKLFVGAP